MVSINRLIVFTLMMEAKRRFLQEPYSITFQETAIFRLRHNRVRFEVFTVVTMKNGVF
jgi:hypothetical protein